MAKVIGIIFKAIFDNLGVTGTVILWVTLSLIAHALTLDWYWYAFAGFPMVLTLFAIARLRHVKCALDHREESFFSMAGSIGVPWKKFEYLGVQ